MKTPQCQTRVSQSGSASYMSSLSTSAMNPLSSASLILLVLLISAIPICKSSPIQQQRATIDQYQLLKQLEDVCSSYLSADLPFRIPNVLGELCVLMLVQKSKKGRDNPSKRSPVMHPLLQLVPQLHTRRERGEEFVVRDHLQGPGGIQSRGYFLYRPRNGRRSLEFE
ncbi:neuromedin-U isoform X2 [Salvelinus fontinalis]|uniref:neuromedin-U isoform X1 n=1 Tax=Salvelinus sp. IW2-2015 TaxID=2691554 RepID=UPI000CDFB4A7|nr:neuromedin-U isoform X1 [Salvelinus alpinus]XP_023854148.1 neuromedin-U isoform X1 [Salvelinus alpinus]XP_055778996.1 neuromedin-U isoform X2 [Salvelinus fontinalis]